MAKRRPDKERERLQALIEEAIVDCYNEEEQHIGLLTMVEDNVVCPFRARVIGEEVEVTGFEHARGFPGLKAVCQYKGKKYLVDITSLEWVKPRPKGFEWVEAYFAWRGDKL